MQTKKLKVVVIGGGTGIYPVTTALKQLDIEISTIITVADNGGSTGRIRDEFGFQPVGDLRQSLAAMAEGEGQEWIRKLLLYRFKKGDGLKGHNLGNLILTALQDITGSTSEALLRAKQVFHLSGAVIPATENDVNLKITYEDGSTLIGEDYLNQEAKINKQVTKVELTPSAKISSQAKKAIQSADYIIIGPGDHHSSLLPALLPQGTVQAFTNSKAKIIFIANLMERRYQTDKMTLSDCVKDIENIISKQINLVIVNAQKIPDAILKHYEKNQEHPVVNDLDDGKIVKAELISDESVAQIAGDGLHRSFLRHDSNKLLKVFKKILVQDDK